MIKEHETIWYPEIYGGRTEGLWIKPVSELPEEEVIRLVQQRANEDGEWAIENGFVGDNEDTMRKMMAWVSKSENIIQCVRANPNETVDWVCRDLANATKHIMGTRG
jgi:hypothetical protein